MSGIAVHAHGQFTAGTTTPGTVITVTAANLATAGFANNDDVLVLGFGVLGSSVNNGNEESLDFQYSGASITQVVGQVDTQSATSTESDAVMCMQRVNLGTLADFTVVFAKPVGTGTGHCHKAEIIIVRLADFGEENTDWFWAASTTDQAVTTTLDNTDTASLVWTPGSIEDWVALGFIAFDQNETDDSTQFEIQLDTSVVFARTTQEPESSSEEWTEVLFHYMPDLAASQHTLDFWIRQDSSAVVPAVHQESSFLVFRAAVWPDLFTNMAGTVAMTADAETEIATITDSISQDQDAILLGGALFQSDSGDDPMFMWVDKADVAIEPVTDAISVCRTHDATDDPPIAWLGLNALSAGTQNLDLKAINTGPTGNATSVRFLVWGLLSTEVPVPPPTAPSDLTALAISDTEIDLGWTDNSDDETGFLIEQSLNDTDWGTVTTTAADATTYSVTGLDPETLYYYRITAVGAESNSDPSASASDTTEATPSEEVPVEQFMGGFSMGRFPTRIPPNVPPKIRDQMRRHPSLALAIMTRWLEDNTK